MLNEDLQHIIENKQGDTVIQQYRGTIETLKFQLVSAHSEMSSMTLKVLNLYEDRKSYE